jgi:hypothetical protein
MPKRRVVALRRHARPLRGLLSPSSAVLASFNPLQTTLQAVA